MAKSSPMIRSFNAGEFSEFLTGRVDLERYPSSLRSLLNYVAAPQGPAIPRSGTAMMAYGFSQNKTSRLIPFVFSETQSNVLEFSEGRMRIFSENGLLVYPSKVIALLSDGGEPIRANVADLDAEVGDEVFLSGFPASYNLNGEVATVTAKSGDEYTIDVEYPEGVVYENGRFSRVYHVEHTFTEEQRETMNIVQSVDVMYLLTDTRTKKLSRKGTYEWTLEDVEFVDGPYMDVNSTDNKLTPSATGNAVSVLSSDTGGADKAFGSSYRAAISGSKSSPVTFLERDIGYELDEANYFKAFDDDDETYWAANAQQKGIVGYEPATSFVADGYSIHVAKDNQDTSYAAKDYAPSSFTFEGFDGTNWIVLDRQEDYVLYDGNKSVFFEIPNEVAYEKYRLNVTKLYRNGLIEPRVQRLVIRERDNASITLVAGSTENINGGDGFQSTDVDRLIRVKGDDGSWRPCKITAVNSTTSVTVTLLGEPLPNTNPIREWRLGYWSDTTGWPVCGDFFDDRLWMGGPEETPDLFAGSVVGDYENFSQADQQGTVLDDSAIVARINSRKLSRIKWIVADTRGLLFGTGSGGYTLSAASGDGITARNFKVRPAAKRGSANVEPASVDNQTLFVQYGGRAIRELAFVFEADGYKAPSMSQLANHLGAVPFVELAYAQEPHSIVWVRKRDGSLVGMTYNREENVVAWHRHNLAGAYVESITTIPQSDGLQDALWLSVVRTVAGKKIRFIERLTRFFDFGMTLAEANYVDCGLRYTGSATKTIYGLCHLDGAEVYGLADGNPVGPLTVENGSVELAFAASNVILGLGFDGEGEVQRLETGAADGTAQGKTKRVHNAVVSVWNSFGGEIGVYNEQQESYVFEPIPYVGHYNVVEDVELFTGLVGPFTMAPGYDKEGRLAFRRKASEPLPLCVVAIMPQLNTQDR